MEKVYSRLKVSVNVQTTLTNRWVPVLSHSVDKGMWAFQISVWYPQVTTMMW